MSLNPVQFGTEVVDQFGRYLMTTFPIADPRMEAQVREALNCETQDSSLIQIKRKPLSSGRSGSVCRCARS